MNRLIRILERSQMKKREKSFRDMVVILNEA